MFESCFVNYCSLEMAPPVFDLHHSCNIDGVSETQIVDAVQFINYSVTNLIDNILYGVQQSKLSYHNKPSTRKHHATTTKPDSSDITPALWSMLIDVRLSRPTRDLVVEAVLRNLVFSLLHKHFFKGGRFFGVGSETLHELLETMLDNLVASGKVFKNLFSFFEHLLSSQKTWILLQFSVGVL